MEKWHMKVTFVSYGTVSFFGKIHAVVLKYRVVEFSLIASSLLLSQRNTMLNSIQIWHKPHSFVGVLELFQ